MTNDNDARGALTDEQIMKAGMNHFRRAQTADAALAYIAAVRECLALAAPSLPAGKGQAMMTDEQILDIAARVFAGHEYEPTDKGTIEFARAILAAPRQHGEVGAWVQPIQQPYPFPYAITRTDPHRGAVTYIFDTEELATQFVKATQAGLSQAAYAAPAASAQQDEREAVGNDMREVSALLNRCLQYIEEDQPEMTGPGIHWALEIIAKYENQGENNG